MNRGPPSESRTCLQVAVQDYLPSIVNLIKYSSVFVVLTHIAIMLDFFLVETDFRIKAINDKYASSSSSGSGGSGNEGKQENSNNLDSVNS